MWISSCYLDSVKPTLFLSTSVQNRTKLQIISTVVKTISVSNHCSVSSFQIEKFSFRKFWAVDNPESKIQDSRDLAKFDFCKKIWRINNYTFLHKMQNDPKPRFWDFGRFWGQNQIWPDLAKLTPNSTQIWPQNEGFQRVLEGLGRARRRHARFVYVIWAAGWGSWEGARPKPPKIAKNDPKSGFSEGFQNRPKMGSKNVVPEVEGGWPKTPQNRPKLAKNGLSGERLFPNHAALDSKFHKISCFEKSSLFSFNPKLTNFEVPETPWPSIRR